MCRPASTTIQRLSFLRSSGNFTATVTTPVLGDLGGGSGVLFLPMIFNVDATMSKFIPLFGEGRGLRLQAQAYNVFNHPEFVGLSTGSVYNTAGATDESDGRRFQLNSTSSNSGVLGQDPVLDGVRNCQEISAPVYRNRSLRSRLSIGTESRDHRERLFLDRSLESNNRGRRSSGRLLFCAV